MDRLSFASGVIVCDLTWSVFMVAVMLFCENGALLVTLRLVTSQVALGRKSLGAMPS